MSATYISADLRKLVIERADGLCEYCLIAEEDSFFGCGFDHVISEKHGGGTDAANLAYACYFCNEGKGSDVGSIDWRTHRFSRFFNPRRDRWWAHFLVSGNVIEGRTFIGRVTAKILGFNHPKRLLERQTLQAIGRYPSAAAIKRMRRVP